MLSIIIPTLNEEKYLPRLLLSIKKQKFFDYEIIVSDADSNDDTIKIAIENNCRFVVDKENKHPSFQRNNGAKIARGSLLLFLDADTVLQEDFLNLTMAEFKERQLIAAGFYIKFNPNRFIYNFYSFIFNSFLFWRQHTTPAAVGAGILVEKKGHNMINGFDTSIKLAEDFDYCSRVAKLGKFRILRSQKMLYSSRRLEREGKIVIIFKWLAMFLYPIFKGKITRKIINYDLGGGKK